MNQSRALCLSICLVLLLSGESLTPSFGGQKETFSDIDKRLVERSVLGDVPGLKAEIARIRSIKASLSPADYASALCQGTLKLQRAAQEDKELLLEVYRLKLECQTALIDAPPVTQAHYYSHVEIRPAQYQAGFDDADFAGARRRETELALYFWQSAVEELRLTIPPANTILTTRPPMNGTPEEIEAWERLSNLHARFGELSRHHHSMTNQAVRSMSDWYYRKPHDYGELRGFLNHYLGDNSGETIWSKISNSAAKTYIPAMVAAVQAAPVSPITPRTFKVQQVPAPGSQLPAVARPSKVMEKFVQKNAPKAGVPLPGDLTLTRSGEKRPAAGASESSGVAERWAWVLLGLVALAGGWVWVRSRS